MFLHKFSAYLWKKSVKKKKLSTNQGICNHLANLVDLHLACIIERNQDLFIKRNKNPKCPHLPWGPMLIEVCSLGALRSGPSVLSVDISDLLSGTS